MASEKKTRRRYTDEEKAAALVALQANGHLEHPIAATANALQVPDSTLDSWKTGRSVNDVVIDLAGVKKQSLLDLYEQAVTRGLADILNTDTPATWRDAIAIATFTDKILLLRGQPTQINEHRRGVDASEARRLLAEYTERTGDEAQARALLAQDFPEAANALVN